MSDTNEKQANSVAKLRAAAFCRKRGYKLSGYILRDEITNEVIFIDGDNIRRYDADEAAIILMQASPTFN